MVTATSIALDPIAGALSLRSAAGRERRCSARCRQHGPLHHALSQGPDGRTRRRADPPDPVARDAAAAAGGAEANDPALDRIAGRADAGAGRRDRSGRQHKRLEDLYLPFKPKKQTLATTARERGLEPLAERSSRRTPVAPISTRGPPTSSTPTRAFPPRPMPCSAPATSWPSSSASGPICGRPCARSCRRPASWSAARWRPKGPTTKEKAGKVPRLLRLSRGARQGAAASRAGDQPRREGQGAARADRGRLRGHAPHGG